MRDPALYATTPLGSMQVMQVDAGTAITDERSGETITVDDETFAVKGRVIFCTERTYEALKSKVRRLCDA